MKEIYPNENLLWDSATYTPEKSGGLLALTGWPLSELNEIMAEAIQLSLAQLNIKLSSKTNIRFVSGTCTPILGPNYTPSAILGVKPLRTLYPFMEWLVISQTYFCQLSVWHCTDTEVHATSPPLFNLNKRTTLENNVSENFKFMKAVVPNLWSYLNKSTQVSFLNFNLIKYIEWLWSVNSVRGVRNMEIKRESQSLSPLEERKWLRRSLRCET